MALEKGLPKVFAELKRSIEPPERIKTRVWDRVDTTARPESSHLLGHVRDLLTPSAALAEHIKHRLALDTIPVHSVTLRFRTVKWVAACSVIALVVHTSPLFFLAPATVAESLVSIIPTAGELSYSFNGTEWNPVAEQIAAEPGMWLRTGKSSEASFLFGDSGVVRLQEETAIKLHDLTARASPAPELLPTLTLYRGDIWVQGLVPSHMRGLTIATSHGFITVNEGSVRIAEDDIVEVEVYDRRAVVQHENNEITLVAGERTRMWEGNIPLAKKIPEGWYDGVWVSQNIERDAVHRSDISQRAQEHRASIAGILPTSPLYPAKRLAEKYVLITRGQEARIAKKLEFAQTRLNEAAALLAEGDIDTAMVPLAEYKGTLLALASDPDEGSLAQFLLQRAVTEMTADIRVAQPGDYSYVITKTVLEASADLPGEVARTDANDELLIDALTALLKAAEGGQVEEVRLVWADLQPSLALLGDEHSPLSSDVRKEARALLSIFALAINEVGQYVAEVDPELMSDIAVYLPPEPQEIAIQSLTEEEVMEIAWRIREKVFTYHLKRPRLNQFVLEMKALEGHPEQGRILRRLTRILPDGPEEFPLRVTKEIVKMRYKKVADETVI